MELGSRLAHSSARFLFQKDAGRIILGSHRLLYFWTISVTSSKRPVSKVMGSRAMGAGRDEVKDGRTEEGEGRKKGQDERKEEGGGRKKVKDG